MVLPDTTSVIHSYTRNHSVTNSIFYKPLSMLGEEVEVAALSKSPAKRGIKPPGICFIKPLGSMEDSRFLSYESGPMFSAPLKSPGRLTL